MVKNFSKMIEDFTCTVCQATVKGDGYTNHCPVCLSSKHVDINPGDRSNTCQGIMYAVSYEQKNGAEWITHQCSRCGHTRKNKVATNDKRAAVIALSAGNISEYRQKIKR